MCAKNNYLFALLLQRVSKFIHLYVDIRHVYMISERSKTRNNALANNMAKPAYDSTSLQKGQQTSLWTGAKHAMSAYVN